MCHVNSSACRVYVNFQLHFRGHFRVHFRTSTLTFIRGCTATPIFYTYTHLWMYSGLYSATATFSRSFSCTFSYSHAYIHLWTHSNVSILHLYSPVPVDVQRSLQCYSYIFAVIFVYIFVQSTPTFICGRTCLCSLQSTLQRPITCLVFKVAKSAWLHFTHQTEISLFTTFYTYI